MREGGSQLPATTNLMGFYKDLNYNKFQDVLDIISWDNYPDWHGPQDPVDLAAEIACTHDLMPVSYTHLDVYKRQRWT